MVEYNNGACFVWTKHNNNLYILLGQESSSGDLSSFGGKRERYECDPRNTSTRELREETLGVLPFYDPSEMGYNNNNTRKTWFFFFNIPFDPFLPREWYTRARTLRHKPEISRILWVDYNYLKHVMNTTPNDYSAYVFQYRLRPCFVTAWKTGLGRYFEQYVVS